MCSRSEERAREIAGETGAKKWFTDYEEMMKDPDVEAVDICTELARHTEIAAAALQSGKHVFSEILLSKSLEETDQLISLREESGTIFMVGFTERFDVRRAMVKSRIDSGELGDLVSLYGRRNCSRRALDNPRDITSTVPNLPDPSKAMVRLPRGGRGQAPWSSYSRAEASPTSVAAPSSGATGRTSWVS